MVFISRQGLSVISFVCFVWRKLGMQRKKFRQVDVFIFSSVFVWDYAEWFCDKWGVTSLGWHLDWWTTRQLHVELSPVPWLHDRHYHHLTSVHTASGAEFARPVHVSAVQVVTDAARHVVYLETWENETQSMMGSACLRLVCCCECFTVILAARTESG